MGVSNLPQETQVWPSGHHFSLNSNCTFASPQPLCSDHVLFLPFLHLPSFLSFLFHSPMRPSGDLDREWTLGLFTGKISGSQHQISGFLGYTKRADTFPVRRLREGYGSNIITQGRMWVESSRVMSVHECGCVCCEIQHCLEIVFITFLRRKPKNKLPWTKPYLLASQHNILAFCSRLPNCPFTLLLMKPAFGPIINWPWTPTPLSPLHCAALHKHKRMSSKWRAGVSLQCSSHPFKLHCKGHEGKACKKHVCCVLSQPVFTY